MSKAIAAFLVALRPASACCPPDPNELNARCIGSNLMCKFDDPTSAASGTCTACGVEGSNHATRIVTIVSMYETGCVTCVVGTFNPL